MRRDVYLNEYEEMSFSERFYIYRRNWLGISIKKLTPPNPLDWSVRALFRGAINLIKLPIYLLFYLPLAINGAMGLKTRYVSEPNKHAAHHKDIKVLK